MLSRVHEGHLGIDRCKRRARDVMFWAGMARDVEQTVRRCRVCAEHAARPMREPMLHPGDEVVTADGAARRHMRVSSRAPEPRSYLVTDGAGKVFRRNRRHLIKIPESPSSATLFDETMREDEACGGGLGDITEKQSESFGSCVDDSDHDCPSDESPNPSNQRHVRAAAIDAKKKLKLFFGYLNQCKYHFER
ncbi:Uncharacterized protein OBRU01_23318, partial [Operophtera brumata]